MRSRTFLLLAVVAVGVAGCGNGTPDGGSGTFALRARWQQPRGASAGSGGNGACPVPSPTASFGLGIEIPATADTVRIVLNSEGGRCCVDILSASAESRAVTITQVPQGAASATVSAFLEQLQPGDGGDPLCPTLEDAGQACGEPGTLTFTSDATDLTVVPGVTADVAPEIYSVPFVLREFAQLNEDEPAGEDLQPAPGQATDRRSVRFAVVDARSGTCEPHFVITQGAIRSEADLRLIPCSDSSDTLCSEGGSLAVEGLQVFGELPDTIQTGPALVTITACNFQGRGIGGGAGNCAEPPGFEYSFEVLATPTPTAELTTTRTPTHTVEVTTTGTPTPTVELTTTRTPTPTAELTATPTPTLTVTLTTTPTPTSTPTSGALVIRPLWQQSQSTESQGTCPAPTPPSFGLDVEIPPAAGTVRIFVSAGDEERFCCVDLPRASAQAGAVTITDQLPGDVGVTVSAFLETLQPGDGEDLCPTLGDVGQACGASGMLPPTLTFTSDEVSATVVAGDTVEVQPEVYSIPFVLREFEEILPTWPGVDLRPAPDTATDSREVRFVVVDARSGTCELHFAINQQATNTEATLAAIPCSDSGDIIPCSQGGQLGVDGLQVVGELPAAIQTGPALAIIAACNFNGRFIDNLLQTCPPGFAGTGFIYGFTVLPTPTNTQPPPPTATPPGMSSSTF